MPLPADLKELYRTYQQEIHANSYNAEVNSIPLTSTMQSIDKRYRRHILVSTYLVFHRVVVSCRDTEIPCLTQWRIPAVRCYRTCISCPRQYPLLFQFPTKNLEQIALITLNQMYHQPSKCLMEMRQNNHFSKSRYISWGKNKLNTKQTMTIYFTHIYLHIYDNDNEN